MELSAFKVSYNTFRDARNAVFALAGAADPVIKREQGENNAAFALRLLAWLAPHRRTYDAVDKATETLRDAGVALLDSVFLDWETFEAAHGKYLAQQGWSELANVWLFTTPLQALNWTLVKQPAFADAPLSNWRNVVLLDWNSSPTRNPFYALYRAMADKEPFPTADMQHVDKEVQGSATPASLMETAKKHGL